MKRMILFVCAFILLACSTSFTETYGASLDAAFESDNLKLAPVKMPEITGEAFEFPDELWPVMGMDKPDDPYTLIGDELARTEKHLLSVSPSGHSSIYLFGDTYVSCYDEKYRIVYPSQSRGVADEYGNLMKYYLARGMLGEEGIVYSPNGRYAAIYNSQFILRNGQYFIDPIIIDLSTGEMILTATYDNSMKSDNFGVVITGCFSADDQYLYYIKYGNSVENRISLYRYDLEFETTSLCCYIPYLTYYPYLCETVDGSFLVLEDVRKTEDCGGVVEINKSGDEWVTTRHEFTLNGLYWHVKKLQYSAASGYAICTGDAWSSSTNSAFMVFKPENNYEGLNEYHAIGRESHEVIDLNEDDYKSTVDTYFDQSSNRMVAELLPYTANMKTVLSPDGQYALILTRNGTGEADSHLYLIKLEKLECKEVRGIDASQVVRGALGSQYTPLIEWNSETLIIYDGEKIGAYRFEFVQ